MVQARRILSGDVLADPRSRQARQMLPLLEEETRMEQLCGLEAMAQIAASRKEFRPDHVVAYALTGLKVEGNTILAEGAAFRSRRRWYRLAFRCALGADRQSVQSFAFSVGQPIARRAWERYNLFPD